VKDQATPHLDPPQTVEVEITLIHAWRFQGIWRADVSSTTTAGHGSASNWMDAINAGIEDLKLKLKQLH
jgi:hypothetical protein